MRKDDWIPVVTTGILSRINALRDSKRNMALRLADPAVANNQPVMDVLLAEMKRN